MAGKLPRGCGVSALCFAPHPSGLPAHAAPPAVNGVAFHPFLPLLATASGQRRYPLAPRDGEDNGSSSSSIDAGSSPSAAEESDSDDSMAGSEGQQGAGQPPAVCSLAADENVLRVWRCAARLLPPLEGEGGGAEGAAAAAGSSHPAHEQAAAAADGAATLGPEAMAAG